MLTDLVIRVNRASQITWRFSFGEHVEQLCHAAGLPMPIPFHRHHPDDRFEPYGPADWGHANTIEALPDTPLGRRDPRFRTGNLLFSLRQIDTIGVIDPDRDQIVWAWGPGTMDGQHQPTMLHNGNILLFDNGTYRGWSIVRELEPDSGRIVWQYEDRDRFFSPFRSGNQRLANGNTLICECDAGRVFEVTLDGAIVWDFQNPFVAQSHQHLGRRIHRATRYTAQAVEPVLAARADRIIGEIDETGRRPADDRELVAMYQAQYRGSAANDGTRDRHAR